jgi:TonB family protein
MTTASYQSLLANRPSTMGPFVIASVAGHAVIVIFLLVLQWVMDKPRVDLDQKPIIATLVKQGKKREETLLPRKEPEAPPPPEEKIPIPTPGVKPEPKPKVTSDKPQPADKKKSLFDALNKTAKAEEEEGEEDGDPNGDSAKQEGEKYFGVINAAVRRNYDVSNTIPESERIRLTADVLIRLDANGQLLEVSLTHSSGNDVFDGAVVGAIKKAAPFGPPPPHLKDTLKNKGVPLRFRP